MSEEQLTPQAQIAINKYLTWKLVPAAAIVTVLVGIGGYVLKDIVQAKAYNEVTRDAMVYIITLSNDTYAKAVRTQGNINRATEEMESAKKEIESLKEKITIIVAEAETMRSNLQTVEVFRETENLVTRLTEALVSRDDFTRFVTEGITGQFTELQQEIRQRLDDLKKQSSEIETIKRDILKMKDQLIPAYVQISDASGEQTTPSQLVFQNRPDAKFRATPDAKFRDR